MTQMQKEMERLIAEGKEFQVTKHPYGGWCIKYPVENTYNGYVHKSTCWASYREDGSYVYPTSHVNVPF